MRLPNLGQRISETKTLSGGPHAIFSHPRSNVAGVHYRSAEGVLRKADIPQRLRITKDVSVLRANHFPIQTILSGVWEVVEASTGVNLTEPEPVRMGLREAWHI